MSDRLRKATEQAEPQHGRTLLDEQPILESRPPLAQMAALLDVSDDAIVLTDDRHQIAYWNGGAARTYGWQAKDALGQVFEDLIPTQFPIARQEVQIAIRDRGMWEGELTHVRKDGRRIVVSNRTTRAQGRSDLLSVSREITPMKEAQEAMVSAKAHLAREVDELTRDLQRTAVALQAEIVGRTEAERPCGKPRHRSRHSRSRGARHPRRRSAGDDSACQSGDGRHLRIRPHRAPRAADRSPAPRAYPRTPCCALGSMVDRTNDPRMGVGLTLNRLSPGRVGSAP